MAEPKSVRLADALRVGEFRALWTAETVSVAGDQLARVALSLLVYARTSSAVLTGLTYALTFVPSFLGGIFLSGLADRFPRRAVIITTDLVRAALAAAMAIPGLPPGLLWTLVGLLTFAAAPYKAAQLALLPQVLEGDRFTSGMALRQISNQGAQIAGFLLGGVLVTAITPQGTLLLNAGTFGDNSPSESFWSTFKHEEHYRHVYATKTELVAAVDNWIRFYNSMRRHSAIGMLRPDDYEKSLQAVA